MNDCERLVSAAEAGDIATVRSLLGAGADPNVPNVDGEVALCVAAAWGHEAIVRLLIEHGADVNWESYAEAKTALMAAANNGHSGILRVLVRSGAKVDAADDYGETSLCRAVSRNHLEAARVLLEHGADPRTPGEIGTPLELAKSRGNPDLIALLHAAGG